MDGSSGWDGKAATEGVNSMPTLPRTPLWFPIQSSQFHCPSCSCTGRVFKRRLCRLEEVKWRTMPGELPS
jgi:hypothetical protein